jgi:hypothetical protein
VGGVLVVREGLRYQPRVKLERHAFISYGHIDNEPFEGDKYGWVTLFHKTLEQMLSGRLGEEVRIWRDERLRPNDVFSDEIAAKLEHTAVLISVLSPRYVKSDWCRRELARFCEIAEHESGLVLDNKCRVFKVIKLPLDNRDDAALPDAVKKTLGYEFFEERADGASIELTPSFGEHSKQEFLRRIVGVASDIKRVVSILEADKSPAPEASRATVYVATCSQDRRDAREMVVTELERLGCTVLPNQQLPTDESAFVDEVRTLLARSRLSVHLIGAGYGLVPDGSGQKSAAELQNELAAQRCREVGAGDMARLIWVPAGTQSLQPAQAAFIARLHTDADAQFGADLITGDLETLKLGVRTALERAEPPRPAPPTDSPAKRRRVHLVHCEPDRMACVELLRLLAEQVDVTRPVFVGEAGELREANHALLMECDEIWLYYGTGDEAWKYHQQNELRRIRALRPGVPMPPDTIVIAAPNTEDKDVLVQVGEPGCVVLDFRQGPTPDARAAVGALLGRVPAAPTSP